MSGVGGMEPQGCRLSADDMFRSTGESHWDGIPNSRTSVAKIYSLEPRGVAYS